MGDGGAAPSFWQLQVPLDIHFSENIWQFLRQNWLSNRVFEDYDAILDAGCEAWNKLLAQPQTIMNIGMREWAHRGQ